MASTYSPSLRLELIGDGDQSGIWGQTTNNNLGALIEQAISGVVTITMVDANYLMSNYNGVVDEARNQVLVVTGTNTAVRNLIAPLVEKTYLVKNNTTGGYAIQIIGSSGLGVTIPNGITTSVYCDGINFYNGLNGSVGNFTVNGNETISGTLSVTGASTFTGIPSGPTAAAGTSTTQLATTAFVTTAVSNAFPSGTRLPFAQATAPTGWTQDTSDTANNRMLRVVNSTGGGTGGSASPILMNVVPSHTHTVSSSGTTSTESANHVHGFSGTTSGMNANNPHSHGVSDPGHVHSTDVDGHLLFDVNGTPNIVPFGGPGFYPGTVFSMSSAATGISISASDINHGHDFSGNTGGISANHTHTVTVSGTTDNGSSQTNWTPRYIDLIICQKN
jgi:hypothetical protein